MKINVVLNVANKSNCFFHLQYTLSDHARERCDQRGITELMLRFSLLFGEKLNRQGLTFHYMCDKNVPDSLSLDLTGRLSNLVVVVDDNAGVVITAYRARNGRRHIMKKFKQLKKFAT